MGNLLKKIRIQTQTAFDVDIVIVRCDIVTIRKNLQYVRAPKNRDNGGFEFIDNIHRITTKNDKDL